MTSELTRKMMVKEYEDFILTTTDPSEFEISEYFYEKLIQLLYKSSEFNYLTEREEAIENLKIVSAALGLIVLTSLAGVPIPAILFNLNSGIYLVFVGIDGYQAISGKDINGNPLTDRDRWAAGGRTAMALGLMYLNYKIKKWKLNEDDKIKETIEELRGECFDKNPLRLEYEEKVRELENIGKELLEQGKSEEYIAKKLWQLRRELGIKYKNATPQLLREYIYEINIQRYGDPLGPSFEYLYADKTYSEIISSAARPNDNINKLLANYGKYLRGR